MGGTPLPSQRIAVSDNLKEELDRWGRMLRDIRKESSWRTLALYCKAMCRDVLFITCLVRTPLRLAQNMVPADTFPLAFFPTTALGYYSAGTHLAMIALLALLLSALWCTFDLEMLAREGCRTFLHAALPALHLEGWLWDEPGEPGPALDTPRSPLPDPDLDAASQVPEPLAVADQESTPPPPLAEATSASRHSAAAPSSPTARTVLLLLLAWAVLLVLELVVIIVPLLVCDLTRLGVEFVLPDPSPSLNASVEGAGPPPPELPGRRIDVLTYLLQLCFLFGALQPTKFLLSLAATFGLLGRVCLEGGWCCAALLRWAFGGVCTAVHCAAAALSWPAMTLAGLRGRLFQAAYDDLYLEGVALHGRRPETHGGET